MKKLICLAVGLACLFSLNAVTADELQELLMISNAGINNAREELLKAQLDLKDAKADFAPKIDMLLTGSYLPNPVDPIYLNPGDYLSIPEITYPSQYLEVFKGQEKSFYLFSLSLVQPIFTWGKLIKQDKIYTEVCNIRTLQLQDAQDKALTELKTRLVALEYLKQISGILEEQTKLADRLVELADSGYRHGVMIKTEAMDAHVKAGQVGTAQAQVNSQIKIQETAVANLCGLEEFDSAELEPVDLEETSELAEKILSFSQDSLVTMSLADSRTNMAMLSSLVEIADLTKGVASASVNWKPNVALMAGISYGGSRFPLIETDWTRKDRWSARISVAIQDTLFDGGKAIRDVKRKASELAQKSIDREDARHQIRQSVVENYTNLEYYRSDLAYRLSVEEQKRAQVDVKKDLLDTGYKSEAEYLQTLIDMNTAQIEAIQDKLNMATCVNTLSYLSGLD